VAVQGKGERGLVMGTNVVSARHAGFVGSPFLDWVDVPSEVRSSVRLMGGRAVGAAVAAKAGYSETTVGSGPWRLTQAGRRLVRSAVVTAVGSVAVLSLLAGVSAAVSGPHPGSSAMAHTELSSRGTAHATVSAGDAAAVAGVGASVTPSDAPRIGGALGGALRGIESAATSPAGSGIAIRAGGVTGAGADGAQWTVVQPGDTLWDIAQRANPGADPREMLVKLRAANGPGIENPVAGQRVWLPQE
jgi:hypothetical protein